MTLTVTFKLGTDPDRAQQLVQNRVSQALPRLPEEVRRLGVTTVKSSSDLTLVVHLTSPDERYDITYLRNYAVLNVKDNLARIPGVGQVLTWGAGDYAMRVWLDPDKVAARELTASDVVRAIRDQNTNAAGGVVGAAPARPGIDYELAIHAKGRLTTEQEFGDIVVKSSAGGAVTRLADVARIELGANQYSLRSLLNNKPAVAIGIFQAPGSNAIEVANQVHRVMESLKADMPDGVSYSIVYDTTRFVRASIKSVVQTLLEALALVVLVVVVFLQTWRASIIPLVAVPVSIVGTFALMLAFGFSINALSLFGLVLAIGIVVDDAIVVVENVERNIAAGLSPRDAAYQAMKEVSGPIVAIALVLVAVFVPMAFVSGLTGEFYRQFALTISISTVISAFNSLTLSPALAATLLKGHDEPKDRLTRGMDFVFGAFFRTFNRVFARTGHAYGASVGRVLGRKAVVLAVYGALVALTWAGFQTVPRGFIPAQDKQYLVAMAQLPDGAALDRTEAVVKQMSAIAMKQPGVESAVAFPGLSINGFTNSSNAGVIFITLDPFEKRRSPALSGFAVAQALNGKLMAIQDAFVAVFPPPPVLGLGTIGGFKLQLEDRGALGYEALYEARQAFLNKAYAMPELAGLFSSYQINVPQLHADVDRVKAKQLGVAVTDVFDTMQVYLGSLYVNDFNRFGRTYQVKVQADEPYRADADDVLKLKTRNARGEMVPLSTLLHVNPSFGPDRVNRYNNYTAADINGGAAPGISSGQAQAAVERIAAETLPKGISFEWTELTYQEILAGNSGMLVFPIAVLLVFLVLAALYESWTLPLAVILIVPMALLSAIAGVWLTKGDNNIFTQISLVVLVGLAAKNSILIVEFAQELERRGRSVVDAAIEASRLRLRPILMTSFAFIMGVVPLALSTGAGAEMRRAIGVAVFSGMLGVTLFGLLLTPLFYVLLRTLAGRWRQRRPETLPGGTPAPGAAQQASLVATEPLQ
jgi:multidrug efflux pump